MTEIKERKGVKLVKHRALGKIYFRPATKGKQPSDYACRACGNTAKEELTTERIPEHGVTYAISCCYNRSCYDYVVKNNFHL